MRRLLILGLLLSTAGGLSAQEQKRPRVEFTSLVAHWAQYDKPEYLDFIAEARPEVAQFGFYGAHFWSLAHTSSYKGYPAHFPVRGLSECGDWFEKKNQKLHDLDTKVVGHFNIEFLVGDPESDEGPRGFFKFYRKLWNEKLLGPKPVDDPLKLLEKNIDGTPIQNNSYNIGGMKEYWACLRNPHWQQVLKAWTKRGIERGLDGFIINYFYRHNCHCEHCQAGFRKYMKQHFSADQMREKFKIDDIQSHKFDELVYWHKPEESTPLRREMLRWSQISNKQVYDDVFMKYGRSLKPDLILAQWNHLSRFSQIRGDERCLLPTELWGKGEDYTWYSMGAAGYYTDLENRFLGEGTLQARYIRGAFDDKPFTLGKYENTRTRVAIAELCANGGAPMGFYARYTNPDCRRELTRYYQFIRRHNDVFKANRPHSEVLLIYPRSSVHRGDLRPVEQFKSIGQRLLDEHVLFDVLPDELLTPAFKKRYRQVVTPTANFEFENFKPHELSRFEAPYTVRVSASRPNTSKQIDVHFVNYNRTEPPKSKNGRPNGGRGTQDEKPISAKPIKANFRIPHAINVNKLEFLTPESNEAVPLEFQINDERLLFEVPEFLVYGIVRIHIWD